MAFKTLVCLFFALFYPIYAFAVPLPVTTGLLAYYSLDGGTADNLVSGNVAAGTVSGAVSTTDRDGNANGAFLFDGIDDNIIIGHHADLNLTQGTISAWVSFTPGSDTWNIWPTIVSKDGAVRQYALNITRLQDPENINDAEFVNGTFRAHFGEDDGDYNYVTGQTLADTTGTVWHHVAQTWDSSDVGSLKLYVDGVLETVDIIAPAPNGGIAGLADLVIGSSSGGSSFFTGKIDDVAIYSSVLSEAEVASLYSASASASPVPEPATVLLLGSGLAGLAGVRRRASKA